MAECIERLYLATLAAKDADPRKSRTARLFRSGRTKLAKKVAEEAIEVAIEAAKSEEEAVVRESADLLYNLVVLWAAAGIRPSQIWSEMTRRERLFGLAEKLPKKVPARSAHEPSCSVVMTHVDGSALAAAE